MSSEEDTGCRAALYPGYRQCGKPVAGTRPVEIRHETYLAPACKLHLHTRSFELYGPMDLKPQSST